MMSDVESTQPVGGASGGSALREAAAFLLPIRSGDGATAATLRRAPHWFVPIGLAIGVAYALVFAGVWSVWGEYFGLRLVPAAVLLGLDAALLGRRLLDGACEVSEALGAPTPRERGLRAAPLTLCLLLILKLAIILTLPKGQTWAPGDWRRHLVFLYPQPALRPLVLMPLWGRWGVLLTMSLGRARADETDAVRSLMAGVRLTGVLAWLVPCVVLTEVYCTQEMNVAVGLLIAAITLASTYAVSVGLSWRLGGQTRASVLAAGAVAEIAFLLAYAPFGRAMHHW